MSKKGTSAWLTDLNVIDMDSRLVVNLIKDLRKLSTGGKTCNIDGLTYQLTPFIPEDAQYSVDYEESDYDLDIKISGIGTCTIRQIESYPENEFDVSWTATTGKANIESVLAKHDVMTELLFVRQDLQVQKAGDGLAAGLAELEQERTLGQGR